MSLTASFTYEATGLLASFTDTSTSSSPINYWYWDFGDGGWSEEQNPTHTYPLQGSYDVYLYVQNEEYDSSEITIPITLDKVDFSFKPVIESDSINIQFTDTSTAAISVWGWDFGDGGSSSLQNPSHVFAAEGIYTVTLSTDKGSVSKVAEIIDISKTIKLFAGGYAPGGSVGVIHKSTDAGTTWSKVYEYPADAKITSIVSL
jgi:PKD repeat protein